MCPNMSECWSAGTATFMLMGSVCTRACKFCSVDTGNPKGWLDQDEPLNTAKAVKTMGLKYVVLTSVNRDDLEDGGAEHYANTVKAIKKLNPNTAVEALTPDFKGLVSSVDTIVNSGLEVFAQNIETVERLYKRVRPQAKYERSLEQIKITKEKGKRTKSGIMVGLGETKEEVFKVMDDMVEHGLHILTIGQYLQPTKMHLEVDDFISPDIFDMYKEEGLKRGLKYVESGPLVRSSYHAERHVNVPI